MINIRFQIKKCHSERVLPSKETANSKLKLKKNSCCQGMIMRKTPSTISIVGTKAPNIYIIDARKNKDAGHNVLTNDLSKNRENWTKVLMVVIFIFLAVLCSFSKDLQVACERTYSRGASFRKFGFKYYFCWLFKLIGKANIFF